MRSLSLQDIRRDSYRLDRIHVLRVQLYAGERLIEAELAMMQATEDDLFVYDAMVEFFPHQAIEDLTTSELSFLLIQAIRLKPEQEATYDA